MLGWVSMALSKGLNVIRRGAVMRLVIAQAICLAALGGLAWARPPAGGPTPEAGWFKKLRSNSGDLCCNEADCHRLDPSLVRSTSKGDYEFHLTAPWVMTDQGWHSIPTEALIVGRRLAEQGGNPTGEWVICGETVWPLGGQAVVDVKCAVPPGGF